MFVLDDDMMVRLNPRNKQQFLNGGLCPPNGNYEIQFIIDSVIAGSSSSIANIPINSDLPLENRLPDNFVMDTTIVGSTTWKDLKESAMKDDYMQ